MSLQLRLFLLCGLLLGGIAMAQAPQRGAKELFYDPGGQEVIDVGSPDAVGFAGTDRQRSRSPLVDDRGRRQVILPVAAREGGSPSALGLSYWIELETPGSEIGVQATEHRVFKSGERIRFHFRSNSPGYISIIQLGASGAAQVLFPDVDAGLADSALEANEDWILPSDRHWFRFDQNPGSERLIVVFARDRGEVETLSRPRPAQSTLDEPYLQRAKYLQGSKDLVIASETETASEIGTYGVNLSGQPVVLEILLKHQ